MQPAPTHLTPFEHAMRVYWEDTDAGACVDAGTFLPRRIPNTLLDALAAQHRPAPAQAQQEEP